jgi:hypothetical protein
MRGVHNALIGVHGRDKRGFAKIAAVEIDNNCRVGSDVRAGSRVAFKGSKERQGGTLLSRYDKRSFPFFGKAFERCLPPLALRLL